ncbi:MAG: hypothetical protein JNL52_06295 [Flavobacteriales bacterium]|nr:hypothetical protein [Flavobacteriales bacterium]
MKPKLKGQDCLDHDPIEKWEPTNDGFVNYWLCLHLGPEDQEGSDLFYVNILSEVAADQLDAHELSGRKKIILKDYSWSAVMVSVREILQQVEGSTWDEVAQKLGQKFNWEFENYRG